ncbi:MAG: iron ABC transporter permease [Clostridia bacterium]|nr:iron ABC transporter permease [Clostridia bacterium]
MVVLKIKRPALIIWLLAAALMAGIVVSFMLGRYPIQPGDLFGILLSPVFPIEQTWTDQMRTILWNVRLPRILLACMVGACLSGAGAAYQGIFQNPMASPDVLGASAGAAFGAALAILLGASRNVVTLAAFAGSLLAVCLVWTIGRLTRGKQLVSLILAGIMISSLFQAGTSYIKLVADPTNQLPEITYWLMGSLSGARMSDVLFALPLMAAGTVPLILLRWKLNLLTLGDDEAKTMGVAAPALRLVVILSATILTASAVAVSGTIGWVGLVVPHLVRRMTGNDYRYLTPASLLGGGLFLLIVDDVSRNLLATEIPLGILTAFVGAPFFLWLIIRGRNA